MVCLLDGWPNTAWGLCIRLIERCSKRGVHPRSSYRTKVSLVMPTNTATSAEASHAAWQNQFSRWYRDGAQANDADGKLAFQRLSQPLFTPSLAPDFKVRRN